MTVRAQLGAIPGGGDLFSLLRFLDPENKKGFDQHIDALDKRTQAHLDAVALHGKAEEIERLHYDAKAWEERARNMFHDRQAATEGGEAALKAAQEEFRQTQASEKSDMEASRRDAANNLKAREGAVKEREDGIAAREDVAKDMRDKAQTARQEAQTVKTEYEALVAEFRRVTAKKVPA